MVCEQCLAELLVPGLGVRSPLAEGSDASDDRGSRVERHIRSCCITVVIIALLQGHDDTATDFRSHACTQVADNIGNTSVLLRALWETVGTVATEGPVLLERHRVGLEDVGDIVPPASAQGLVGSDGDIS